MIKRILSLLLGFGLIGVVIWLGLRTRNDQSLVIWFGLAAALLTPAGFAAIGYALTASNRQVLERLSKVPEIDKLITAAKTQEEKIRLLEEGRAHLLEVVEFEARKESLSGRKKSLEQDALRILNELKAIDAELSDLKIYSGPVTEQIKTLQAWIRARQQGDLVIRVGSHHFILKRALFLMMPFGGAIFDFYKFSMEFIENHFSEQPDRPDNG